MTELIKAIYNTGIIPVLALDYAHQAVPTAESLMKAGVYIAEITFRTDAAEDSIRLISKAYPEMIVGAGTVLTCEQVDKAVAAGAKFIVTPGLNPSVVEHALKKNVLIFPGVATPGEIECALELGLNIVKFFPAEQSGGLDYIKAICGPYKNLLFIPTGGINNNNIGRYVSFNKILSCGGSWMVSNKLINESRFDEITQITLEAITAMLGFEVAHIGINFSNEKEAVEAASSLDQAFGFKYKNGNTSISSAKKTIELTKTPKPGANGHIGISTNSIERAIHYLKQRGMTTIMSDAVELNGELISVYMKENIGGFAVHLLRKDS